MKTFVEQWRIPGLAQKLKNREDSKDSIARNINLDREHWFSVEEARESNWTYSSIRIDNGASADGSNDCPPILDWNNKWTFKSRFGEKDKGKYLFEDGESVLLIGINPRQANKNSESIEEEVKEFKQKQKCCGENGWKVVRFRPALTNKSKISLEATRRNAIFALTEGRGFDKPVDLKELITVDFFCTRTYTSADLFNESPCSLFKSYDGGSAPNWKLLSEIVKSDDCNKIILAWGNTPNKFWTQKPLCEYGRALIKLFTEVIEKCYWFGATASGSPRHAAAARGRNLKKLNEADIKVIFGFAE